MKENEMQSVINSAIDSLQAGRVEQVLAGLKSVEAWFDNSSVPLKERHTLLALVAKKNHQPQSSEAVAVMIALYALLAKHHGDEELLSGLHTYAYAFYHRQKTTKCAYPQLCFALFIEAFDALNDHKRLTYGDISFLLEAKDLLKNQLDPADRAVQGKLRFLMIDCGMMVNRLNKVFTDGLKS